MSQYLDGPNRTFITGGALADNLRVKLTAGKLALAGLADKELGTMTRDEFAVDKKTSVRLVTAAGTSLFVAVDAIAFGAAVYTAANGKVSAAQAVGAFLIGTAMHVTTADNDVVEVLRNSHGDTAGT